MVLPASVSKQGRLQAETYLLQHRQKTPWALPQLIGMTSLPGCCAGITPLSAGFDSQLQGWHLQNPDLAATLKGVRSSTTAQLLLDLSQAPTSPLLRAEQASAQATGPSAPPGRLRLRSGTDANRVRPPVPLVRRTAAFGAIGSGGV